MDFWLAWPASSEQRQRAVAASSSSYNLVSDGRMRAIGSYIESKRGPAFRRLGGLLFPRRLHLSIQTSRVLDNYMRKIARIH